VSLGKQSRKQVQQAREGVYERDGGVCISKGVQGPCGGPVTLQHRVGRGMGGSALYDKEPAFLLTMCNDHNGLETSNADYHRLCQDLGWSVPRWAVERRSITEIPVWYWDGWFYLTGFDRVATTEVAAKNKMEEIYGRKTVD